MYNKCRGGHQSESDIEAGHTESPTEMQEVTSPQDLTPDGASVQVVGAGDGVVKPGEYEPAGILMVSYLWCVLEDGSVGA